MIQNHPRFKQDLETYKKQIEAIPDELEKANAENLLGELIRTVQKLDTLHIGLMINRNVSHNTQDIKEKIRTIRVKLDKKLKTFN